MSSSKSDCFNQTPYHVLIIEDDDQVAELLLTIFSYLRLSADHAKDSGSATHFLKQNEYNLIVADIHLDNENGIALLTKIKKSYPNIDLVTMTGNNLKSIETKARELQVLYHFVKPFSIDELTSVIKHISHQTS